MQVLNSSMATCVVYLFLTTPQTAACAAVHVVCSQTMLRAIELLKIVKSGDPKLKTPREYPAPDVTEADLVLLIDSSVYDFKIA